MSNTIRLHEKAPVSEWMDMSNGLTSVFINVLGLSGSRLAKTREEKRLIVWILERNQTARGMGTVGFDVCEMPWDLQSFEDNKTFLLSVLDGVKNRLGWETLDYLPNASLLLPCIELFAGLVKQMRVDDIDCSARIEWLNAADREDPILRGFPKCKKHGVLLTSFGCQVCQE